jgi:hypothetical protein
MPVDHTVPAIEGVRLANPPQVVDVGHAEATLDPQMEQDHELDSVDAMSTDGFLPAADPDLYAFDMGTAIEEAICLAVTPEQWLQHEFLHAQQSGALKVLQLMRDADVDTSPQALIMVPCYKLGSSTEACTSGVEALAVAPGQQRGRLCPFAFITVREMLFKDGPCFCNTCTNHGCERSAEDAETMLAEFQLPEQRFLKYEEALGPLQPLCLCAETALNVLRCGVGTPDMPEAGTFASWYIEGDIGRVVFACQWAYAAPFVCRTAFFVLGDHRSQINGVKGQHAAHICTAVACIRHNITMGAT